MRPTRETASEFDALDRALLNGFQNGFPLSPRPYAEVADRLGTTEDDVLARLRRLSESGAVSRVGAVVAPHRAGWSTLAAMAVPADRLDAVAGLISGFREVNHNYEREHRLNLWFVVTGRDPAHVADVLRAIAEATGIEVLDLPMESAYRLSLGFELQWS